jgi:soluble lytic murein transglycosylase-like protein
MITLNRLETTLLAARDFTSNLSTHRFAAALLVAVGALAPPALVAGELYDQDAALATQQIVVQMPPPERVAPLFERTQFDYPAYRRYVREQKEAKIRAQTQYLVAKFGHSESNIRRYVELAWKEASQRDGVPAELLIAMMQKESSLRPKVQSHYGAQGLMQVVRRWHHDKLGPSESLFDPEVNIRVGADVLEEYLEKADGSLTKALKKYSGNARGYATKVLNESHKLARVAAEAARDVLATKG